MIVVAGIADEGPVALVIDALEAMGADVRVFDQRRVGSAGLTVTVADAAAGGAIDGELVLDGERISLTDVSGLYLRPMDDQLLPGLEGLPPDSPARRHARLFHELLFHCADMMAGRVLNRPGDTASNQSKPFQAQVIRASGFDIPETLITNDPSCARAFIEGVWNEGGRVIYKSVSGVRSIVQEIGERDLARLDRIGWCPTQFQRLVTGTDVRVHVVGQTVLATRIVSAATDYRYAARQTGEEPVYERIELDAHLNALCVGLSQRLRLPLAGIDLRRTEDGRHVCFEVNPSPAFSFYERHSGVPVSAAIARYLTGEVD
jgi:hypothetical protein